MAEQDYIDFEALADMAPPEPLKPGTTSSVPKTKEGFLDFEALADIPEAGSTLAKHRWQRLTGMQPEQMPLGTGQAQTYDQMTQPQPKPATPMTDFENQPRNQGLLSGVEVPPDKGLGRAFTKEDFPNAFARGAANAPGSVLRLGSTAVLTPTMLVLDPKGTVKGLVDYTAQALLATGAAGAWAAAKVFAPGLEKVLAQHGITPEEFVDMVAEDPAGMLATLYGIGEVTGRAGKFVHDLANGGGISPKAGDFNTGDVHRSGEMTPEKAAEFAKRKQADTQAATTDSIFGDVIPEKVAAESGIVEAPGLEPYGASRSTAAGYTKGALTHDITTGKVESLDPTTPFENIWTLEGGFKSIRAFPEERAPGHVYPGSEATIRNAQALAGHEAPYAEPMRRTKALVDDLKKKGPEVKFDAVTGKSKPTRKGMSHKRGQTLGMGLGGAQDFFEKRGIGEVREAIKETIRNWIGKGLSFDQAHEVVEAWKAKGKIDGPQESAFKREVDNIYGEQRRGQVPPEEGMASEDRIQATMYPLGATKPQPVFTYHGSMAGAKGSTIHYWIADVDMPDGGGKAGSKLSAEVIKRNGFKVPKPPGEGGTTMGIGLGGAQKQIEQAIHQAKAIAASIVNSKNRTSATKDAGLPNTQAAQALFAPEVGTGPTSMQAMSLSDNILNTVRDLWQSDFYTRSGVESKVRTYFPKVNEAATHHIQAQALAFLKSRTHTSELSAIFGQDMQGKKAGLKKSTIRRYLDDFADLIHDDHARALEQRGLDELSAMRQELTNQWEAATEDGRFDDAAEIQSVLDDIGPPEIQVPKLDDAKRAKMLQDPKIQAAIKYFHDSIKPQVDSLTENLDIRKRLTGPLGLYLKFTQIDPLVAGKRQRTRPVGTYVPTGTATGGSRVGATSSQSPWNVRPGRSGSSNRATGKLIEGRAYENDLRYMIEHTFSDRLLATTKNELRSAVREAAVTSKKKNGLKPIPPTVMVGGLREPLVGLPFEGPHGIIEDTHYVPDTVKRAFDSAMEVPTQSRPRQLLDLASSAMTAQVLVLPAEAVRHGFNAITATVNTRFMHPKGPVAEIGETLLSATTLGLSKMATALHRAYHLEGPALAEAIERYGASGGLRLSGYEGTNVQRSMILRASDKIPGVHQLRDFVFGDPGSTKGLSGIETRLRIVIGEAIKEMQPELSDVELAAKVNDSYGTYVSKLMPGLTKLLAPFDPFVRAGVGLTKSGIRLLEGRDVSGQYSPLIHAQVIGTITAIMVYNRLLDEEQKWPWERPEHRPGDIVVARRNGRVYRLGFADLANGLKRGAEFTGLTAVTNALIRGERAPSVLASEWTRGVRNAYVNRAAPLWKALNTLTTGKSFAQSPSGDFYSTSKPTMTGAKGGILPQRLKDVLLSGAPAVGKGGELLKQTLNPKGLGPEFLHPAQERLLPDSYLGKVAYDLQDMFSIPYVPIIEGQEKSAKMGGEVQRRIQQEFQDTTRAIAREAINLPPERRLDYIQDQIESRVSDEVITVLGNPMTAKPAAFKSIMAILYKAPGYNSRAEAFQQINQAPQPQAPPP